MRSQTIKKGTTNLNNSDFGILVGHVITRMTGNTNFPTPAVPLPGITTKLNKYNDLVGLVRTHEATKTQRLNLRTLRVSIQGDVDRTFAYVRSVSNDIDILASSGFPLTAEPTPVGDLPAPENFSARSVNPGSASLKCKSLRGADSYIYQYTISPNPEVDNWVSITHTACRIVINDLTPGTQYKFRVCGVGAKGAGQWAMANCYINY